MLTSNYLLPHIARGRNFTRAQNRCKSLVFGVVLFSGGIKNIFFLFAPILHFKQILFAQTQAGSWFTYMLLATARNTKLYTVKQLR